MLGLAGLGGHSRIGVKKKGPGNLSRALRMVGLQAAQCSNEPQLKW